MGPRNSQQPPASPRGFPLPHLVREGSAPWWSRSEQSWPAVGHLQTCSCNPQAAPEPASPMLNTGSGEAPSSSSGRAGRPPTSSQPPRVPGLLPRGPFLLQVTRPLCCLNEVTPCSGYWAHLHCPELLMFGFIYYIKKKKLF